MKFEFIDKNYEIFNFNLVHTDFMMISIKRIKVKLISNQLIINQRQFHMAVKILITKFKIILYCNKVHK